jgi:TRAP-type mannitol/chloroaromatic compound transport system permease large subunit
MLAIAFGPVKGSVFAFFYIEAEMQTDTAAAGTQLTIRVGLLLGGEVDVLGLISVSIKLLLELEYSAATGVLAGTGTLSIRVKICWFLTIKVSVSVRKEFAKVGGQSRFGPAPPAPGLMLAAATAAPALVLFPFMGDPVRVPAQTVNEAVEVYLGFIE